MKKSIVILIMCALCFGLCACGSSAESIELPTKPQQMAAPSLPAEDPRNGTAEEHTEAQNPTGKTYPWEVEFNEEDYVKFEITAPQGDKIITWREGTILGREAREIYEWPDGTISDSYYYPSGNKSHSYTWSADGSYSESHYLDNGYTDLENMITYTGTTIYEKNIGADGSWSEFRCNENGIPMFSASMEADGAYREAYYFENGNMSKSFYDNPNTGEHREEAYFENGNIKHSAYKDANKSYSEQEYFDNGSLKYSKNQSPENTMEEQHDEEGFLTYFYSKDANYEIELIADETGKLIRFIENGTVYENDAIPDWVAGSYNFRG